MYYYFGFTKKLLLLLSSPRSPRVCISVLLYALTFLNIHPFSGSCVEVFHPKRIQRFNREKDKKRTGNPRLNSMYTRFTNLRHTPVFDRVLPSIPFPFIIYFFGTKRNMNIDSTSIFPVKCRNFIMEKTVSVPKIIV